MFIQTTCFALHYCPQRRPVGRDSCAQMGLGGRGIRLILGTGVRSIFAGYSNENIPGTPLGCVARDLFFNRIRSKAADAEGRQRLARCIIRCPFALNKMSYDRQSGVVIYRSKLHATLKRNYQPMPALRCETVNS